MAMSSVANSPRLLKGALVCVNPADPMPSVTVFQYNPDSLTRTLQAQGSAESGDRSEAYLLKGPPAETIRLEAEIDATDQLEHADANSVRMGIHRQLAALEVLLYPASNLVTVNTALLAAGTIEIVPPVGPLTLFIWGERRVLPVRLTEFSVNEEAYDVNLNPIRAKVSLSLRVLSYDDLPLTHPGYHLFLTHQRAKETMAAMALGGTGSTMGRANVALR
jgi:hypothetical protein